MQRRVGTMRGASVLVLCLALPAAPALAGDFTFTSRGDKGETHTNWSDTSNWSPEGIPTITDDATVASGLLYGARIKDDRAVHSLVLDSGLNVYRSGSLTATGSITHNSGYFINSGTVFGTLFEHGYLSTTGRFTGDVTVSAGGAVINQNDADGSNMWTGDVLSNAGWILNGYGTWRGDVISNAGIITNNHGASWIGNMTNAGEIDSTGATWIGDVHNSGQLVVSGLLIGSVDNSSSFTVAGPLSGVTDIVNTGNLNLSDGAANTTLRARSLADTGTESFDFDPAKGRVDRIILSGDYSGTPTVLFNIVDGKGRTLADMPVIQVGGANIADPSVLSDMPAAGIISYAFKKSGNDWVIASTLNGAPDHVAGALALADSTVAYMAALGLSDTCGRGAWVRGIGSNPRSGDLAVDIAGAQFGYDFGCSSLPGSGATLGLGLTLSTARGSLDQGFAGGDRLTGTLEGTFGGLYANVIDGAFRAILQGQVGGTQYRVSDPGSLLDTATLNSTSASFSSTASYVLALGPISLTPEIGRFAS